MKTAAVGKRKTSVYTEYMISVDVEKFAQIGESVERRHCPTRKILPYGRSGFPGFSAIRVCVLLFITVTYLYGHYKFRFVYWLQVLFVVEEISSLLLIIR